MKDHEKRELVNNLRDIAVKYAGSQQLREKIARCVLPALDGESGRELPQIEDDPVREFKALWHKKFRHLINPPGSERYRIAYEFWKELRGDNLYLRMSIQSMEAQVASLEAQALAQQISGRHPVRSQREVDFERRLHRLEVEQPGELVVLSRPIGHPQESDEQLARQQVHVRGWNECRAEVLKLLPVDCALQNQENLTAEHGGESPMEAP